MSLFGHFCGLDNVLVIVFIYDYRAALFCLDPSWSKRDPVWCWYSVTLFMSNRRLPKPSCEQASFWRHRQLFSSSGVIVFESIRGWKAFSEILSNSVWISIQFKQTYLSNADGLCLASLYCFFSWKISLVMLAPVLDQVFMTWDHAARFTQTSSACFHGWRQCLST